MTLRNLFCPISLGGCEIRNRIVLSPMGIGSYNSDETVTDEYVSFIGARSIETGLIVTTAARVSGKYGKGEFFGCYSESHIPGLRRLAHAVHMNGSKIFLQILQLGGADWVEPLVPSAEAPAYSTEWEGEVKPKALTEEQIRGIVSEFALSAKIAKEAGFDGVELGGAENFLISDFICPSLNRRTDIYGGSFENRMRFPVEIVEGIHKACGRDFPVGFKYNAFYDIPDGIDLELGARIAERMVKAGVCYIHEWSFAKLDRPMSLFQYPPMPNLYQPRNTTLPIARHLKSRIKDVPVIAAGGILKPDEADKIIAEGDADMVAVGRGFIADQGWAFNAKSGTPIRPCMRCHVCHNEVAMLEKIVACSVNPDVLGNNEQKRAEPPMDLIVVGGGPGGIVAAVAASKRGHRVRLYEREKELGGKLIPGSRPDFKHEFIDLLEYLRMEAERSSVEINTGIEVTEQLVAAEKPDVLIVAAGAVPVIPKIDGIDGAAVVTATEALLKAATYDKSRIVVIGGGDVGCETALMLARFGNDVTIIELLDELMKEEEIKHNTVVLENMLEEAGVSALLDTEVKWIDEKKVGVENRSQRTKSDIVADLVVISAGYRENESAKRLCGGCGKSYQLGDCVRPGRLRQAVEDGYRVGNII